MEQIYRRILFITPFCRPSVGGAETYLSEITDYLRSHHYHITILTYQPITSNIRGEPLEERKNLTIHRYSWIGFNLFHKFGPYPVLNFLYLTPYLFIRSLLFLLFHAREVDAIDAHGLSASFCARFLKVIFRKRTVATTLALYNLTQRPLFAKVVSSILRPLDKILAESEESKKELVAIGIPSEKIAIFSEWVDIDRFRPRDKSECKVQFGWQGKFIVLFVGRAIPIKGADTLIEVARKTGRPIHFVFVSTAGPQVTLLQRASREMENVIFVGNVDYQELHLYYNAADLFVIPSRYEEAVARVMPEAIASGTPVIGSKRGAIPGVLDPSVSIVCEPDVEELQRNIEYLFDHPRALQQLTGNCRDFAVRHFSSDNARVIADSYSSI